MSDEFWRAQLAHQDDLGPAPETSPGTPHYGFYLLTRYLSLPFPVVARAGSKIHRPKVQCPVAIWQDDELFEWHATVTAPDGITHYDRADAIDDLFSNVCREAIEYERYVSMVETITAWRAA